MKTDWSPTPESLDRLLSWLDSDRDKAARKYEKIRLRLITFFSCDGCGDVDEILSDITFDRVMKKLEQNQVPDSFVGDKTLYFLGFARNIRLEHLRSLKVTENPPPHDDTTEKEHEEFCLEECGQKLEPDENWLAVEYYRFEKAEKIAHRKKLAEQFGLTLAGLRTRIHRIRDSLRPCIEECLEKRLSEML
jgi:hypothetical protein